MGKGGKGERVHALPCSLARKNGGCSFLNVGMNGGKEERQKGEQIKQRKDEREGRRKEKRREERNREEREGCCPAENSGIMTRNEEGNGVDLLCQLCDDAVGARRRSVHLPQREAQICACESLMCYFIFVCVCVFF